MMEQTRFDNLNAPRPCIKEIKNIIDHNIINDHVVSTLNHDENTFDFSHRIINNEEITNPFMCFNNRNPILNNLINTNYNYTNDTKLSLKSSFYWINKLSKNGNINNIMNSELELNNDIENLSGIDCMYSIKHLR